MSSDHSPGMTVIVKTVTRLTAWLILLYGIHITLHGHISVGGGFAGGVIVALSFIHLMLAYGGEAVFRRISKRRISLWATVGALMFLAIALAGLSDGYFFRNFLPPEQPFHLFSAGTIPLSDIAISFIVCAGLFAVFVALVTMRFDGEEEKEP